MCTIHGACTWEVGLWFVYTGSCIQVADGKQVYHMVIIITRSPPYMYSPLTAFMHHIQSYTCTCLKRFILYIIYYYLFRDFTREIYPQPVERLFYLLCAAAPFFFVLLSQSLAFLLMSPWTPMRSLALFVAILNRAAAPALWKSMSTGLWFVAR